MNVSNTVFDYLKKICDLTMTNVPKTVETLTVSSSFQICGGIIEQPAHSQSADKTMEIPLLHSHEALFKSYSYFVTKYQRIPRLTHLRLEKAELLAPRL